jgi:predicted PurR-regulated permease PerM
MSTLGRTGFWLGALVVVVVALWLLDDVLLPFVVGLGIAYFFDPVVQYLERRGLGRGLAAILVVGFFSVLAIGVIVATAPILERQLVGLIQQLVDLTGSLIKWARPHIERVISTVGVPGGAEMAGAGEKALAWLGGMVAGLWTGGLALVNLLSLVFVTPVVAYYLLKDWPSIVSTVDSWFPRDHAATIRELLRRIDSRLAGFIRGQALVCLALGVFYAIALSVAGLKYGLIVGLLTGVLAFVPYIGATVCGIVTFAIAFLQFDNWLSIGIIAAIYLVGQFLEGNILAPKLVGERIGLHPVWLIFALMSGGALFGFLGVLLAVPVAAVVGVLVGFSLERYLESPLYRGGGTGKP